MAMAIEGDQKAFEVLYERHRGGIMNYVRGMMFDQNKVEEITQEVFLKAYRQKDSYDQRHKFTTWIYSIARNHSIDVMRKKGESLYEDFKTDEDSTFDIKDEALHSEEAVLAKAENARVREALDSLPEGQREVLSLRALSELSYAEIANVTGKSESSVKSLIFRAKQGLLEKLKEGEEE